MKLKYKLQKIAFVFFIAMAIVSCDQETEDIGKAEQNTATVYELIQNNANLSIFKKAIELTGLNTTLNTADNFTIFAPTDATFEAYLIKNKFINSLGYADITLVPVEILKTILLQHIVKDVKKRAVKLAGVEADYMESGNLTSMANPLDKDLYAIKIDLQGNVLKVNESDKQAVGVDFSASNGFVNVIENIISLTPLTPTIKEISNITPVPGDAVTINGDHFVGITSVTFEGIPAKIVTNPNRNTVTVTCPVGFVFGKVIVTTKYGVSASVIIGEKDFVAKDYLIYDDVLKNGWYAAGWAKEQSLLITSIVKKGTYSLGASVDGWQGFGFAMWDTPIDATLYQSIKFSIYSTVTGKVKLFLVKDKWDNGIDVDVIAGKWTTRIIDLNLDTMFGATKKIDQFLFQESTGNANVIYVDNAGFFKK